MTTDATVPGEPELDPLAEIKEPPSTEEKPPATPEESSTSDVDTKPDAVQQRINKITAEKHEERRGRIAAEERLAEMEGNNTPAISGEPPKLEDFDFDESKYNDAVIDYKVDSKLAAQAEQTKQQATDDTRRDAAATFANREAEFGKTVGDYAETVKKIPQLHPETLDIIYSMENGPQMAHYLGSHLDVADKIATASPVQAAVELGRIAATLAATTKTVETSNAPKPVDTLSGSGGVGKDQDEMSMAEIMALP